MPSRLVDAALCLSARTPREYRSPPNSKVLYKKVFRESTVGARSEHNSNLRANQDTDGLNMLEPVYVGFTQSGSMFGLRMA